MKPVLVHSSFPDELLCSVLLPGQVLEPVSVCSCSTVCIGLLFWEGACMSVFFLSLVVRGTAVPWCLAGDTWAQNSLTALVTTSVCAGNGERDVEHWKALCHTVDGCYKSVCQFNPYHRMWLFIPIFCFLCSLLKKSKRSANESGEEHSAKYSNSNNSGNYRERNLLLHSCVSSFIVTVIFYLKRFRITNTLHFTTKVWYHCLGYLIINKLRA